jgi:hypothetical protein
VKMQLYTADWQPVSELVEATARSANVIRANEAARFSFGIPHDSMDAAQLKMATNILMAGRIPARITRRDASGPEIQIQAIGCEDLLNHLITPRRWTYWNKGPDGYLDGDLATITRDMLKRARLHRWTTLADFNGAAQKQNVKVLNLPDMGDSVILATEPHKQAERYLGQGVITLRRQLPETALPGGKLVRWTEHIGDENRIRVRTRTAETEPELAGAAWGKWMTAVHAEDVEDNETIGVPAMDGGPWVEIQLELTTEDRETADNEDEPTIYGTTPVLAGVELVWREATGIAPGNIPVSTGVTITDTEYNRLTHLRALVELCELHGYTFRVRLDDSHLVLDLAESFGVDRSDEAIFRDGDNAGIEVLRDTDDELANVLHCWGAGSGAEQLYVELQDEDSIARYGERHADWEDSDIADIVELQAKGQEELEKRSAIKTEYQVITTMEQLGDAWLQDSVTVIDPRSGSLAVLPIEEIRIEDDANAGEIVRLGLDTKLRDIVDVIVEGRTKPSGVRKMRALAAPVLRAEGRTSTIRLVWTQITGATGYDLEHMPHGASEWKLLASGIRQGNYEHTELPLGSRHQYRVYAKRGDLRSPVSNTAAAYAKDSIPPGEPFAVVATPGPAKVVRLSWTAPADKDIAGYEVWRKAGDSATDPTGAELVGSTSDTEYTDVAGERKVRYSWFVRAVDTSGNASPFSMGAVAIVSADGLGDLDDYLTPAIPDEPTGLVAIRAFKAFALTWAPNPALPRIAHYEAQYATSNDGIVWGDWVGLGDELKSTYIGHHALDPALHYKYRVKAVSLAGVSSDWSIELVAGQPGKASLSEDVVDQLARERLSQGVQTELDGLGQGLTAAEGRLDSAEGRLSGTEGRLDSAETSITNLDGEIALKASQSEVDTLSGTVSDHSATLLTHATAIAARVTQTVFNVLEGRVTDNEATLTTHATAIAARVTQTVFDTLAGRVTSAEGTLSVHATDIAARVTTTVFDALEGRVTTTESDLTLLDNAITAAVSRITTNEAFIAAFTLTPEEISTTVSEVRPGGSLYSTIQQNSEDIALRVIRGEVISEINLSTEAARIAGKKVLLDGDTEVTGDFRVGGDAVMGTLTLDQVQIENASQSIRIRKEAVEIRNSSLVFVAETLLKRADGKAITSAETRPITTDSTGTMTVARPVIISSAEGIKAYKRGLNVWSGTAGAPDLINNGVVQPKAIAPLDANKIASGVFPLERLPQQLVRTAPGASDPTVYWGEIVVPGGAYVTVTFGAAFAYSNVRVLAQYVPTNDDAMPAISNVGSTGFRLYNSAGSDKYVHWAAFCASQDTGGSTCTLDCEGSCQSQCQLAGVCQDTCQDSCQLPCEMTCQTECEDYCQDVCMLSCQTDPNMWT